MNGFVWKSGTSVWFGKGACANIARELSGFKSVLLVYGGGSIRKNGIYDIVMNNLREIRGCSITELSGVSANPSYEKVLEGVKLAREKKADLVLAVGGGSVIDAAKAIAFIAPMDPSSDPWGEYFMAQGKAVPKGLKVAVVLTLPAAGSEMSESCVVTNYETGYKRGVGGSSLRPDYSFVDPSFALFLPKEQRANGVCDIYAHLHERFFSPTADTCLTDGFLLSAMKTVIAKGSEYAANPTYENAAEVTLASTFAHNQSLSVGRVQDWCCHWLEHELSTELNIAHGRGLAICMPAWMKYASRIRTDRFVQYGREVWGLSGSDGDIVKGAIESVEKWIFGMGLPIRFTGAEWAKLDIDLISRRVLDGGRKKAGHFIEFDRSQVKEIYALMKG